jgi:hypothetical protein
LPPASPRPTTRRGTLIDQPSYRILPADSI